MLSKFKLIFDQAERDMRYNIHTAATTKIQNWLKTVGREVGFIVMTWFLIHLILIQFENLWAYPESELHLRYPDTKVSSRITQKDIKVAIDGDIVGYGSHSEFPNR